MHLNFHLISHPSPLMKIEIGTGITLYNLLFNCNLKKRENRKKGKRKIEREEKRGEEGNEKEKGKGKGKRRIEGKRGSATDLNKTLINWIMCFESQLEPISCFTWLNPSVNIPK